MAFHLFLLPLLVLAHIVAQMAILLQEIPPFLCQINILLYNSETDVLLCIHHSLDRLRHLK